MAFLDESARSRRMSERSTRLYNRDPETRGGVSDDGFDVAAKKKKKIFDVGNPLDIVKKASDRDLRQMSARVNGRVTTLGTS